MTAFVLVVDDDESIRESLCEILADEGHRAVAVENGQQALDLLRTDRRPCLILLDLMMPVMDGARFRLEQLRDPALSRIPVAVITAAGASAAASVKTEAFLPKPFRIDSVLNLVQRFCATACQTTS
jgi:CheY-like chemotaxis protein